MVRIWGRSRGAASISPRGSPGKRCYAIGDVHGRLDLLDDLLVQIRQHHATRPGKEGIVVFLGDVIDRGPDSKGVVERLRHLPDLGARVLMIKGNHEEMLVRGLGGQPDVLRSWLDNGGYACARSYGVEIGQLLDQPVDVLEYVLASAVPRAHLSFLSGFLDSARFGDYLLVHAGIRPGVPVHEQSPQDLRWIRTGFLESSADHGCVVVHGHSISLEVEERSNRIGVDTGAYQTGVLTAIWMEDDQHGYLKAIGTPDLGLRKS
jgi:serine/threonine protein phosphatase 1